MKLYTTLVINTLWIWKMYKGIRKKEKGTNETLQKFINKHIVDLENVQRNKKKEKGEFPRCQVSSN
jgi:hypothetical protein